MEMTGLSNQTWGAAGRDSSKTRPWFIGINGSPAKCVQLNPDPRGFMQPSPPHRPANGITVRFRRFIKIK
jgi:hypothetical protein